MNKIKNVCFLLLVLLIACTNMKQKQEDFVGVWKSESGQSTLYLNEDGSCNGELDSIFFRSIHNNDFQLSVSGIDRGDLSKYNVTKQVCGKWYFKLNSYYNREEIEIYVTEVLVPIFVLDIGGSGFWGNKPPWYLFFYIGDPDNIEKYKFLKQGNEKYERK
jgi:hypothetical protein